MYERLLDKKNQPTFDEMKAYCKKVGNSFEHLNNTLKEKYHTIESFSFPYGNHYGWCVTHRIKSKLFCHVFCENDAYCVMVRLENKNIEELLEETKNHSQSYQEMLDHKYPCGDGSWLYLRVTEEGLEEELLDVLQKKAEEFA